MLKNFSIVGAMPKAIKLFDVRSSLSPAGERARQHRAEYPRTICAPDIFPRSPCRQRRRPPSAKPICGSGGAVFRRAGAAFQSPECNARGWASSAGRKAWNSSKSCRKISTLKNTYNEGMQLFEQGKVDEAIERVETAARATGLPKYSDRAQILRRVKETTRAINETLNSPNIDPKMVTQAKADLDLLVAEYGENPALLRLRSRLEAVTPRAVAPLQEQARTLKAQVERATTLDEALYLGRQARAQLDQIRNLAGLDENLDRLQNEIDRLIRDVMRYQDELAQATASFENHRSWPAQADRISLEAATALPQRPGCDPS